MDANDPRHGTYAGAVAHWLEARERPCADCARAEWRYRKRRKLRHLHGDAPTRPAIGYLRRIRALHALGWTGPEIARRSGLSIGTLRSIGYHDSGAVLSETAKKIEAVYEQLSMRRPEGTYADRARSMAARKGWAPPLAWDDIDTDPHPRGLRDTTRHDLLAEWHDLRDAGESIEQAAVRLGVTVGAIERAEYRRKANQKETAA